jgi:integrase
MRKTMATISKTNTGRYLVQVRRKGYPAQSKTFTHRKDAETWGKQKELEIERGELPNDPRKQLNGMTLRELVEKYRDEVSPKKRSGKNEQIVLNAFLRDDIVKKLVADISVKDFAKYRDKRLEKVAETTLKRELNTIQNIFKVAISEWQLPLKINPVTELGFTAKTVERDRRPTADELERIIADAKQRRNPQILQLVILAYETGMRRSELLAMRWAHLNLRNRTLLIPDTKTEIPRRIPLGLKAMAVLEGIDPVSDKVFTITANALRLTWDRMMEKLGIEGLTWHDARHDAVSTLFEHGLSIGEVSLISGHRDWKSLKRYTNPRPADIIKKLDKAHTFGGSNAAA